MPAPVYLVSGFLDSGKTTLIRETIYDPGFMEGFDRVLLICFEQGEVEYDNDFLDEHGVCIEYMDDVNDLTVERMHELDTVYHPDAVFIEWNGTQPITETILTGAPDFWPLVQILATVDASTFQLYIGAMRQMLYEQLRWADTVIVNRCKPTDSGSMLRGNIKAINRRAQIYYEGNFGEAVVFKDGFLPFDINADVIDIKDDDYGLWYMDAMEDPRKYDGKHVILRGMFAEEIPGYKQTIIMGRRAMVCCEADTSLIGLTVTGVRKDELKIGDWIQVEGNLKTIPFEDHEGETVVLYATRVWHYPKPKDEYVTFS